MNITGGTNLSLYEVQEAADIVSTACDAEVNMIFGSVINENLKDEIIVTVIATGFEGVVAPTPAQKQIQRPSISTPSQSTQTTVKREMVREEAPVVETTKNITSLDDLDIPAFLRNSKKR